MEQLGGNGERDAPVECVLVQAGGQDGERGAQPLPAGGEDQAQGRAKQQ
jgi:hypothetical protein